MAPFKNGFKQLFLLLQHCSNSIVEQSFIGSYYDRFLRLFLIKFTVASN